MIFFIGKMVSVMQSDGLMVFDIVQVIQFDLWDELKRAIDKSDY